ncbi:MAG TPA: hypothetical protein VHJ59_08305 [Nitrososphaera sp.]|jgi:hypothetical protein|nr:hypothetical protein [Nitrososphaera sp.]
MMNKPIIAVLAALAVLTSTTSVAYAQYGGTGGSTGTASPEQLQECEQLGIPRENCSDVTILAKKRLTAAQDNPSTGSGTPMLSTESGQMTVFIGVLAAIFGGVAAAFFFKGRGARPVKT